jgi:hypothetical protein
MEIPQALRSALASQRAAAVTTALLLAGTVAVFGSGELFHRVTGIPRQERLAPPDDVAAPAHDDPMPFLIVRDRLDVRVGAPMTVRELLEKNHLQKPHLERQVLDQLGNPPLDSTVEAGTTLHLTLTPPAVDIPATTSSGGRR